MLLNFSHKLMEKKHVVKNRHKLEYEKENYGNRIQNYKHNKINWILLYKSRQRYLEKNISKKIAGNFCKKHTIERTPLNKMIHFIKCL